MYRKTWLFLAVVVAALMGSAAPSVGQSKPSAARQSNILATVNGVPITQQDLDYAATRMGSHQMAGRPANKKNVLDAIIQQEVIYQQAVKQGLESDPKYQEDLRKLEAMVQAFKRERLSQLFLGREIFRQAKVSDSEVREYYEKNTTRLRTEFKLWQILKRNKEQIDQVLMDLKRGERFEDVAGRGLPKLPPGVNKPWELGYLRWVQLPEPWRDVVYALKPGERSDIIRGPNHRFWIVKLIDRREIPAISYEESKPTIAKMLRAEKIERFRENIGRDFRAKAHVTYAK